MSRTIITTTAARRIYDITPWQWAQWVADGRIKVTNRIWVCSEDVAALIGQPVKRALPERTPKPTKSTKSRRPSISVADMAALWGVPAARVSYWKRIGCIEGLPGRVWSDEEKPVRMFKNKSYQSKQMPRATVFTRRINTKFRPVG